MKVTAWRTSTVLFGSVADIPTHISFTSYAAVVPRVVLPPASSVGFSCPSHGLCAAAIHCRAGGRWLFLNCPGPPPLVPITFLYSSQRENINLIYLQAYSQQTDIMLSETATVIEGRCRKSWKKRRGHLWWLKYINSERW